MIVLYLISGIVIGGTILQFTGAVAGGIIGLLASGYFNLRNRIERLDHEVAWLRSRYEESRRHEEAVTPVKPPQPESRGGSTPVSPRDFHEVEATTPPPTESPNSAFEPPPVTERRPVVQHKEQPFDPAAPDETSGEFPFGEQIRNFFNGENLLVKLGVVILIFGVSFLVKYAAQHGMFPIELRLASAALGGSALIAIGWRVRDSRPVYGQVIQGGGIGILFLTIYAAMRLYHLIPTTAGFLLLVTVCALSATLSVLQDSRSLAIMGSAGGFLAPELASIGSGSPAMLFSYYAVLNIGILAIARQRAWRELNLLGFVSTFVISALWGGRFYTPGYFMTVEPFLVLFFLMYALLPVLYARRRKTEIDGYVDCTLIFGTPIIAFALQAALMRQLEYGLAWSALAAGIFYIATASRLFHGGPERMRNLAEAFLAMGTVFCSLAIPLAFDGRWTSAAWSIEGAAMVWTGLRQDRRLARWFGYILLIASGIFFLTDCGLTSGPWPVLNSFYIGCLLVCSGALFSAWQLHRNRGRLSSGESYAGAFFFAWGMLWWYASGLHEIGKHSLDSITFGAAMAFVAASSFSCHILRRRFDWQLLEWPALGLLPAMICGALLQQLDGNAYPSVHGGWFGWPLSMTAWYLILKDNRHRKPDLPALVHAAPFWLLTLLASWELSGRIMHHLPGMGTWALCAWGAVPAVMVLLISRHGVSLPWPVEGNHATYLGLGSAPLAISSLIWLMCANLTSPGDPWPLPYVPVTNPLDAACILVLITLVCYWQAIRSGLPEIGGYFTDREAWITLVLTLFLWLNAVVIRTVHHWSNVPFSAADLFRSLTVQTTISIFWSLLALVVMTAATRRGFRQVWLAGAALLGTVVVKLFLIDLAGHGSVARIISFVSVGLLVLVIGWFAPVPPRSMKGEAS